MQQPTLSCLVQILGKFPSTLQELCANRIQLNRMLDFRTLYYIDPEDQEIAHELLQLRYQFVEAVERCPEQDLERLWATDLGERYWAMVRSGVQKEPLNQRDEMKKSLATNRLQPSQGGGFGTPGAINALLIAMVYFEPGSMKIDDAQSKVAILALSNFQQILWSLCSRVLLNGFENSLFAYKLSKSISSPCSGIGLRRVIKFAF